MSRRDKGEFTHLANEGVARDFPVIRELLAEDALSVQLGYLDGPALASHVDRWRSALASAPNAVLANRIVDLCGFELFLRTAQRPDRAPTAVTALLGSDPIPMGSAL